jgi:hypothetical protein
MPTELAKRFFNIWVDMDKAGKLEGIASEKGVGVSEVVQEILSPALDGQDENTAGRFVLLRIPERTYKQHLKFFCGDVELAKSSMVGSLEVTGDDFAHSMRTAGED